MRTIGKRIERPITAEASGEQLIAGAKFNELISALANLRYMPKGVYRYKSHEEANEHQLACLALAMAKRAMERR